MKKIFSILTICALALATTGCNSKITEVICTKDFAAPEDNIAFVTSIAEKHTFTFKGKKNIKYILENTWGYDSEDRVNEKIQAYQLSDSKNKTNGITYEYQANGNELISKVTVIREDITDKEIIKDTYLIEKYDEIIKEHKEDGYTCTTK